MNSNWKWLLSITYPLLIVNIIVALLYAWLWCGAKDWKWHEGCLTFIPGKRPMLGNPGGQGWSPIVGFADEKERQRADLRVHEFTHVWQEMMFALLGVLAALISVQLGASTFAWVLLFSGGPVFAVLYGLNFFFPWMFQGFSRWHDAYHKIVFELHAYWVQLQWHLNPEKRSEMWGNEPL